MCVCVCVCVCVCTYYVIPYKCMHNGCLQCTMHIQLLAAKNYSHYPLVSVVRSSLLYLGCVFNMYMYIICIIIHVHVNVHWIFSYTHCMSSSLDALSVMLDSKSTTSLTISWTLVDGVTATDYTISYSNTDNTDCFTDSSTVIPASESDTTYTLNDLEEGTEYSITVTTTLSGGGTGEDSLTATTMAVG